MSVTILSGAPVHDRSSTVTAVVRSFDGVDVSRELLPAVSGTGWRQMVFGRSRGFDAALRGERLRPTDVDACPELPHAPAVSERLLSTRFATLSGGSGTGKSMTAFHAARRVNRAGWAVVELSRAGVAVETAIEEFATMRGPVLAVVDDAQALAPDVAARFENAVDDDHAVLLVFTEKLESHQDETVAQLRAKAVILKHCLDHLDEVGTKLAPMDDRVGLGDSQETASRRLRAAHASARDPWSFMFAASGGQGRIAGTLGRLAAPVTPALLLGAVAVGQLTSLDAGVSYDQAALDVARVTPDAFGPLEDGLDEDRFFAAVHVVQSEHMLLESDGRLRTPHVRVADRALMALACRDDGVGSGTRAIVRAHLMNPDLPIRGKCWLLTSLNRIDRHPQPGPGDWLDGPTVRAMVLQCLTVGSSADRNAASALLCELALARALTRRHWKMIATTLQQWLSDLNSIEVQSIGQLIMYARADHRDLYDAIRLSTSPSALAALFSARATRPTASGWGDVIRELEPDRCTTDHPAWVAAFTDSVDLDAMRAWLTDLTPDSHNGEIASLIDDLAGLDPALAAHALHACAPHLRSSLESDLADAGHGLSHWAFGHMSMIAPLARARMQSVRCNQAVSEHRRVDGRVREHYLDETADDDRITNHPAKRWEPPQDVSDLAAAVLEVMTQVDWTAAGTSLAGRSDDDVQALDAFLVWLGSLSTDLIDELPKSCSAAVRHDATGDPVAAG